MLFSMQLDLFRWFVHFLPVALIVCGLFASTGAEAQESNTPTAAKNWRVERKVLDREFADRLEKIGLWCRDNDLSQQIPETFKLYRPRDLQRQYIFLPSEKNMPVPPGGALGQWLTKINAVKSWQAERIFELAKRAAAADAGSAGFQLLHEVLHFDKDHAEARRILGHRKTADGWRIAPDRIRIRPATRPHEICKWPANSYLNATTTHFEIDSNASEEQTRHLAEQLERWHDVWRQVFFDYWSSPKNLQRWIDGKSSFRHPTKRFRVIFFYDHDHYVAQLAPLVRGVEASTGYYSSDQRVSFFYNDSDPAVEDTWRHELTHQLFRESINTGDNLFEDEFIWLDEGIATYFESLTDFGEYVTLGGFESRRLQYARIRLLLENFYVPLKELSELGRTGLQSRTDIVRIYSQVAGLTDMLMNDQDGGFEPQLSKFLQMMYKGRKIRPGAFEELLGKTYDELDQQYRSFLQVDANRVEKYLSNPLQRTELSLAGSKLTDRSYGAIGKCHRLNWLDVSRTQVSAKQLSQLQSCNQLTQIFLTECPLEPGALAVLKQFPRLEELDLSASSVSDQQLKELVGVSTLKSLRLNTTRITDAAIETIAGMKSLKSLDISRTQITDAGALKLRQLAPGLEVIR